MNFKANTIHFISLLILSPVLFSSTFFPTHFSSISSPSPFLIFTLLFSSPSSFLIFTALKSSSSFSKLLPHLLHPHSSILSNLLPPPSLLLTYLLPPHSLLLTYILPPHSLLLTYILSLILPPSPSFLLLSLCPHDFYSHFFSSPFWTLSYLLLLLLYSSISLLATTLSSSLLSYLNILTPTFLLLLPSFWLS